jgi:hypothetical protein
MVKEELYLLDPWADEQGECSHKYMHVQLGERNIKKAPFSEEIGCNNC